MQSVKIEGSGNISFGEYDEIKVEGVCRADGKITCKKADIDGTFKSTGDMSVETDFYCDGHMKALGNISAGMADIDGMFTVAGEFSAKTARIDGSARIDGNVRCGEIFAEGMLRCGGDINADRVSCDGYIVATGTISADIIDADGMVSAAGIVGDDITIRSRVGRISRRFFAKRSIVDLIEATKINLTNVYAKTVNGHDVTIGPKCRIESVDCTGELFIDPSAVVDHVTRATEA